MSEQRCQHCGAIVRKDVRGSWVDLTDGDGCIGRAGVHQVDDHPWTPTADGYYDSWVGIDDYLGPFRARVADRRWNGFAMPKFTREVAEEVVKGVNAGPGDDDLRWDGDVIVIHHDDDEDERVEAGVDGLYAIGWGSWVWDEVVPDHELTIVAATYAAEHDYDELMGEEAYSAVYRACELVLGTNDFVEWSATQHDRYAPDDFLAISKDLDRVRDLILEWRRTQAS